jgi:hypothetical protein
VQEQHVFQKAHVAFLPAVALIQFPQKTALQLEDHSKAMQQYVLQFPAHNQSERVVVLHGVST